MVLVAAAGAAFVAIGQKGLAFVSPAPSTQSRLERPPGVAREPTSAPAHSFGTATLLYPAADAAEARGIGEAEQNVMAQVMGAFHLTKGIVGTGWLSLPAGVSSLASAMHGIGNPLAVTAGDGDAAALSLALLLLLTVGTITGLTYRGVARCAAETRSASFSETFQRTVAGDSRLVAGVIAANCLAGCVGLAMILGDMTVDLVDAGGFAAQLGPELPIRAMAIFAISGGALWPMCRKLELGAMEWTSVVGVLSTVLTAGVMVTRLIDGSYADGGAFHTTKAEPAAALVDAAGLPADTASALVDAANVGASAAGTELVSGAGDGGAAVALLTFVSMLVNSYLCHQSAPKLGRTVDESLTGSRASREQAFDVVVAGGFGLSSALYAIVAACGFLTFGRACGGNVLDGYAADDPLAACARVAVAVCSLTSFPQMLLGLQDGLRDLLELGAKPSDKARFVLEPALLIALVAVLASACTDLASFIAFNGAVFGLLITLGLPAMMVMGRPGLATAAMSTSRI